MSADVSEKFSAIQSEIYHHGFDRGYQLGREDRDKELPGNKVFYSNRPIEDIVREARNDAIKEYNWISVKDKMPKDCNEDWVLVLVYDGDFRCIPTVAEYRNGHWYGHTFCVDDDCIDGKDSSFEVRYWKPIYDEFHIAEQLKEKHE